MDTKTVGEQLEAPAEATSAIAQSEVTVPIQVERPGYDFSLPAGRPDGTVEKTDKLTDPTKAPFIEHEEKIVHELDADKKPVAFHKEPVTQEGEQ